MLVPVSPMPLATLMVAVDVTVDGLEVSVTVLEWLPVMVPDMQMLHVNQTRKFTARA